MERADASPEPLLVWQDVHKAFGSRQVLRGLNLSAHAGRSLVIIGTSGVGKSVALKLALGLLAPDHGQVRLDGVDLASLTARERRERLGQIGMLFQGAALFDSLSVWENVAFRLIEHERIGRAQARERAAQALALVHLGPHVLDLRPSALSGGMQKRVGLARAIITHPRILFFDEPTTGLDPITADAVNQLIIELVQGLGCAAVTITHDMASVRRIADDVAMLHEGQIIWQGNRISLDMPGDAHVEQFVRGHAQGPIQPVL